MPLLLSTFIVILLWAQFLNVAAAERLPKPCHRDGALSKSDANLIHLKKQFQRQNRNYPVETFSAWAVDPRGQNILCLRHEANNLGQSTIEEFRWYDIGQYSGVDIPPRYVYQRERVSNAVNAVQGETEVKAFENSTETTRAWFTVEERPANGLPAERAKTSVTLFNVRAEMPGIVSVFQKEGLPVGPVVAFSSPRDSYSFVPLHTEVMIGALRLSAVTAARFDGKIFTAETTFTGPDLKAVYAPALFAAAEASRESQVHIRLQKTIPLLRGFAGKPVPSSGNQRGIRFSFPPQEPSTQPGLYVMDHPVTFQTEKQSVCIRVTSYSSLPITVPGRYCHESALVKR